MGEYSIVANLDKKQFLCGTALDRSSKLHGVMEPPISRLLVWLLAVGADPRPAEGDLSWAGDRIIAAGDEGPARDVWEAAKEGDGWRDVTVACLEAMVAADPWLLEECQEMGLVDSEGRYRPKIKKV